MDSVLSYVNKKALLVTSLFLFVLTISSFLIPFISPYAEDLNGAIHLDIAGQSPSLQHWFGTDTAGRDMFTLTIYASLSSIKVAFGVVFLSIIIGVPIGMISAVSGKKIDNVVMRITDGFLAFPPLILPLFSFSPFKTPLIIMSPACAGDVNVKVRGEAPFTESVK